MPDFWHEYIAATPEEERPFKWLALAVVIIFAGFIVAGILMSRP